MTATDLPAEVEERVRWRFLHVLTDDAKWVDLPLDPTRVVFRAKAEMSRCSTWVAALRTKKAKHVNEKNGNGWRKCHTENYWVWYAYDRLDPVPESTPTTGPCDYVGTCKNPGVLNWECEQMGTLKFCEDHYDAAEKAPG